MGLVLFQYDVSAKLILSICEISIPFNNGIYFMRGIIIALIYVRTMYNMYSFNIDSI